MPSRRLGLLWALIVFSVTPGRSADYEPTGCLSAAEARLAQQVNAYRQENGLSAVPISHSLTLVAQWHIQDAAYALEVSGQFGAQPQCTLHTWYGLPHESYTTCCYTPDHAQAQCMWNKPREITDGVYTAFGYENAALGYADVDAALEGWKVSPGHNDVILNLNIWARQTWRAMGVGADKDLRFYFLWFSAQDDPNGVAKPCPESPTLHVNATESAQAVVSWEPNLSGWALQETPHLSPPHWTHSPTGSTNPATISLEDGMRFFRLVQDP